MEFKTVLGKAGPSGEEKVPKPQLNHYSAQSWPCRNPKPHSYEKCILGPLPQPLSLRQHERP